MSRLALHLFRYTWRFPKIRDPFLEVPIIRIIVFWGVYKGTSADPRIEFRRSGLARGLGDGYEAEASGCRDFADEVGA